MDDYIKSDLIIFKVSEILCALDCQAVKEIIRSSKDIIEVKRSSEVVRGVINLRGDIVTVVDLRIVFEQEVDDAKEMVIVVESGDERVGLVVNEVKDVIQFERHRHENPHVNPGGLKKEFYSTIFERDHCLIPLLCLDEILKVGIPQTEDSVTLI